MSDRPLECSTKVIVVVVKLFEPMLLLITCQAGFNLLDEAEKELGVGAPG